MHGVHKCAVLLNPHIKSRAEAPMQDRDCGTVCNKAERGRATGGGLRLSPRGLTLKTRREAGASARRGGAGGIRRARARRPGGSYVSRRGKERHRGADGLSGSVVGLSGTTLSASGRPRVLVTEGAEGPFTPRELSFAPLMEASRRNRSIIALETRCPQGETKSSPLTLHPSHSPNIGPLPQTVQS